MDQIVQIRKRSSVTDRKTGAYSHTGSAKHLMLASPVMKNTPSGGWKESDVFAKKGSIDLVIHDWGLEAFLLFMRIIHCQHQNLPSKVTLEMLAKIAVLADYYACPDTITFFCEFMDRSIEK